ncbi:DMT family transporter [Pseudanabaena sp. FACHB-2040]|uniref:DMT family transporter n=1 Tax=Pseudanabaena sp. FACHB-2040 TaxID=2692859 RepID=UPI001682E569|nr:DMT family transporter [Pseudanabaena sp. FACHB-2040]MBD2257168.1 DMT family transporter [Pseudanabaena sp. FACHB-2040]
MRLSDLAELLLLAALWGGSFLFMRLAAPVLGPIWLIELRVLVAGLALLPLLLRLKLWPHVRRAALPLFVVGCINSALPFSLLAFASLSLPAGFTSIVNATSPLFGSVVAAVWLKERLTGSRLLGFALGFAGVTVLIGWQPVVMTPAFFRAVAAGLLASSLYAIAAPYARQQLAGVPPIAIATASQLSAAVFLLPALPFTLPVAPPSASILAAVLALALCSTSLAYILYFRLIQNVGSTKALTVTYLVPLFAMLWGVTVLEETVTASMVAGCSLILLGTAIANDLLGKGLQSRAGPS